MTTPSSTTESSIRVAIVEDNAGFCESIKCVIANSVGLQLAGTAPNGEDALELVANWAPDVVLVDLGLPGMTGVECVRRLKEHLPKVEFMMLTVFEDHDSVVASLSAGATGYLVKRLAANCLPEAIRELRAGGSPMSSSIARRIIQRMLQSSGAAPSETALTLREEEVLRLLAGGHRYKDIANRLDLSVHTVRTHIHRIYGKLQITTKAELVRKFGGQSDKGHI